MTANAAPSSPEAVVERLRAMKCPVNDETTGSCVDAGKCWCDSADILNGSPFNPEKPDGR